MNRMCLIKMAMALGSIPLVVILHGCHDEAWKYRECVCLNPPEETAAAAVSEYEPPACHWTDSFGFILPNDEMRSFVALSDSDPQENDNLQHMPVQKPPSTSKSRKATKPISNADNRTIPLTPQNCIDINTADVSQLMALPGVGKGRAQAIIQSRSRKPFKRKKDITRIKGIGAQSYRKMADAICEVTGTKH